jgi:hypothetical protein
LKIHNFLETPQFTTKHTKKTCLSLSPQQKFDKISAMIALSKLSTALTMVFAISIVAILAQLFCVLRRRRICWQSLSDGENSLYNPSKELFYFFCRESQSCISLYNPSKELFYFFCWKNQSPISLFASLHGRNDGDGQRFEVAGTIHVRTVWFFVYDRGGGERGCLRSDAVFILSILKTGIFGDFTDLCLKMSCARHVMGFPSILMGRGNGVAIFDVVGSLGAEVRVLAICEAKRKTGSNLGG